MADPSFPTPGHRVAALLGGVKRLAAYAERSTNTAYRWLEPVESGGHGGLIPVPAQRRIIANAAKDDKRLTHADFARLPELELAA